MSFAKDIENWAAKTEQDINSVMRSVFLSIGNDLIVLSPVDTGRFRMNWNFSIGQADLTIDLESEPKDQAFVEGKLKTVVDGFELGQTIYFTNNLDYAIALEFGHSEQRPNGMVRQTAKKYKAKIKKALRGL